MKKTLGVLFAMCSLWLLDGCGSGSGTPQDVATHFSVTPASNSATAGVAFNFTVTAMDASNAAVPAYSGTVHFTSSDGQAALPADSSLTSGSGSYSATLKTAGSQTITATATIAGSSNSIIVSAGPASQFSVTAPTATSLTGATFKFTVTAQDAFKNTVTSYAGSVHFTSSDSNAKTVLPANSSLTSGTKDFSAVLQTVGSESITATDTVTPSITGALSSIAVTAPAALEIANGALPDGAVGIRYHEVCFERAGCSSLNPLDATGGVPPYRWDWAAAAGSSLPPGLGLSNIFHCQVRNQSNPCAAIEGTPSAAGTYNVVLTVTDSATPTSQKNRQYALTIVPRLAFTSGAPPDGVIGTPYNFTFTTSGGKPPITLSVSSGTPPAGLRFDASTGILSGTPSAAELSNFVVTAADSGVQQQDVSDSANISVNPPVVNNSELNGQYAFSFQGFDGQPMNIVGSFTADGAGNLTGGLEDFYRGGSVIASQSFVGTYAIYADKRGIFKLMTSPGGTDMGTFRFVVGSLSAGVASKARFVEFDATGTRGGGFIEKQDPTAFSTAKITGDFAFGVSSVIRTVSSAIGNYGAAGRFTAAAGNITAGSLDQNNDGTVNSNATFTGTYSVAATGRGTMILNVTGSPTPVNALFYVVSSGELLVQSSDVPGVNSLFAGTILKQTGAGTFSNASLSSASVISLHGVNSGSGNDVVLGVLSIPSAGNFTLAADENNAGAVATLNQLGTYAATANGRVTVTGTTHPLIFYLVDANKGFAVGTDSNASTGFFEPQTGGPFTTASANGSFFFGPSVQGSAFANSDDSGVETFNGTGSVTGTMDSNNGQLAIQGFTDSDTITASGRGTMISSGNIFYLISPSKFVLMDGGVGVGDATIEVGEK